MKPDLENMSPFDRWQLQKYGNIIPNIENVSDEQLFESGIDQLERLSEWMDKMTEQDLIKQEK